MDVSFPCPHREYCQHTLLPIPQGEGAEWRAGLFLCTAPYVFHSVAHRKHPRHTCLLLLDELTEDHRDCDWLSYDQEAGGGAERGSMVP